MSGRVVHWLPVALNEGDGVTACGLSLYEHPLIEWLPNQNEADCKRCLSAHAEVWEPSR